MPFYVIEFKRCIIDYAAVLIDEGNLDAGQPNTRLNGKLHFACERTVINLHYNSPNAFFFLPQYFFPDIRFGLSVHRIA